MNRKLFLLVFIILNTFLLQAQDTINYADVRKNNICIELGGTGLLYSVKYERNLFIKPIHYQSIKVGLSYCQPIITGVDQVFITLDYNLYLGKGRMKLLAGAGIVGLIGTNPSPGSVSARQDYLKLYNSNHYAAISKYGTDNFEKAFDLAYTAKLGFKYVGRKIDFYAYYNCFYIRFSTSYNFQPAWIGTGICFKFGK